MICNLRKHSFPIVVFFIISLPLSLFSLLLSDFFSCICIYFVISKLILTIISSLAIFFLVLMVKGTTNHSIIYEPRVEELYKIYIELQNCHPSGSSVYGTLQARLLEWVSISFSRGSSQPRNQTRISFISFIGRWILYHCTTWEAQKEVWKTKFIVLLSPYKDFLSSLTP